MSYFSDAELEHLGTLAFRVQEVAHMLRYHASTELRLRGTTTVLNSSTHPEHSIEIDVLDSLLKLTGLMEEYHGEFGSVTRIDSKV